MPKRGRIPVSSRVKIPAKVIDLGFADRPEAGSDRISRSVGVPLSTIIDLLQDADGSIDFNLPFEGDLLSPEFDYSDMIWSGIFRVLRALIVSPLKLISASIDLASATGSRDAGTAAAATTAPALASLTFPPGEVTLAAELRGQPSSACGRCCKTGRRCGCRCAAWRRRTTST